MSLRQFIKQAIRRNTMNFFTWLLIHSLSVLVIWQTSCGCMPASIRNLVNWQNWPGVAAISPRPKFHVCQNLDEIFAAFRDAQLTIILAFGWTNNWRRFNLNFLTIGVLRSESATVCRVLNSLNNETETQRSPTVADSSRTAAPRNLTVSSRRQYESDIRVHMTWHNISA